MLRKHEIKTIYDQGVNAVAATIRQLYEMIETDDERVHKLITAATSAHLKKIEQLTGHINMLEEKLANKIRQVHQLNLTVKELNKQLKEVHKQTQLAKEAHLAYLLKDSQNSSLPPSKDPRKRTRSLREKSGKKVGSQVGHPGTTLGLADKPDRFIIHSPESCYLCGSSLGESEVTGSERRQVHDLPPQTVEVTEHQSQTKVCRRCGAKNKAGFPAGVKAPVQYGTGVRSVATYLMGYQLLPYERCAEAMTDLFDCHLSPGTLSTLLSECAGDLVGSEMLIKEGLRQVAVLGVDETNLRVSKRQDWVHVSATEKLTLLVHHKKRGRPAIESIGLLPRYEGVIVHDGFSSYDQYRQCRHGQCNAHILRELNYVIETSKPAWAVEMKALLLKIKVAVDEARESGRKKLPPCREEEFLRKYDAEIEQARKLYGTLQRKKGRTKKPQPAESVIRAAARKLASRLSNKREEILLFMQDFSVPFDNNQSERDLRMLKVKQKISGCFRTEKGAEEWCRLRNYFSTMRKQGRGVMETIRSVFAGKRIIPALRC
jgi:transposase